jgi:hypothetical protein
MVFTLRAAQTTAAQISLWPGMVCMPETHGAVFGPEKFVKSMVGGWYDLKKVYRNLDYQRTPGLLTCKQLL